VCVSFLCYTRYADKQNAYNVEAAAKEQQN